MSHRVVLHINELTLCEGRSGFKRGLGGRREAVERALSPKQSATVVSHPPTDQRSGARGASPEAHSGQRESGARGVFGPEGALPLSQLPHRAPLASMRLLTAALLLLLLALCAAGVDGECPGSPLSPSGPILGNPNTKF